MIACAYVPGSRPQFSVLLISRTLGITLILGILLGCRPTVPVQAQIAPLSSPMNLARLVDESENVVLARVVAVTTEPHPQFQNLNTAVVTLEVSEALKGTPGAQLTFRQYLGGAAGGKSSSGYNVGEEIVLMLRKPSEAGLTSPVGFEQGLFAVQRDAAGNRIVRNGAGNTGLFDGIDASSPGLKARLAPPLQSMVAQHHGGPISYEQFKSVVRAQIAAHQGSL
jgi:hypothetical protein